MRSRGLRQRDVERQALHRLLLIEPRVRSCLRQHPDYPGMVRVSAILSWNQSIKPRKPAGSERSPGDSLSVPRLAFERFNNVDRGRTYGRAGVHHKRKMSGRSVKG